MVDYLISRFIRASLGTKGLTKHNLVDRIKRDFLHIPNSEILFVGIPGWGSSFPMWEIKKYARANNISYLDYEFPGEILSADLSLTRDSFIEIGKIVRGEIKSLKEKHGFKKCIIAAYSMGSSLASIIYKENSD